MTSKLRLLKVIVQPVYVMDDGETLTEYVVQPATVPAVAWPQWAVEDFPKAQAAMQAQADAAGKVG